MTSFDDALPSPSRAARDAAHDAVQFVAAAGITMLEPDPAFHYSSTTLDPEGLVLQGAVLPDGRRAALRLGDLALMLGDDTLELRGRTPAEALDWLQQRLGVPVALPTWEIPGGPLMERGAFQATDEELERLARWYGAAHRALSTFDAGTGDTSSIRVWPHHFDLAVLVTLESPSPEQAHTIGIGMTPGDGGIPGPYLYITPWPYPDPQPTPALPAGRWNTQGWYGAVLEASDVRSDTQVQAFLRAAFDAALAAIQPSSTEEEA